MSKRIQNTIFILLAFFSFKSAYSQSLSYNDLKDGEIYYLDMTLKEPQYDVIFGGARNGEKILRGYEDKNIKCIFKFKEINRTEEKRIPWKYIYKSPIIDIENLRFTNGWGSARENVDYTIYIRNATQEEKGWLNACIEAGKFIPKEEALKNKKQENVVADSQTGTKKNTDNKPTEKTEQKYDAFGNPINSKSPNQSQNKTDPKQNTKYDAFGNPIDSNSPNNTVKKEETPNDKPKQQYDAFGNPIADKTEQKVPTKTVNNASTMFVGVAIEYFTCNGKQHTRVLGWIKEKYDYDANDPYSKTKGHEYIKKRTLERYPNASTTMTYDVEYEKSQTTVIAIVYYQNCQYLNQPQNCNVGKSNVINPSKNHWSRKFEELKKDSCVKNIEVIIE